MMKNNIFAAQICLRLLFCTLLTILVLLKTEYAVARSESVSNGIEWLLSDQNADGSWSDDQRKFLDTYTTLETLISFEAGNAQVSQGIFWTSLQNSDNSDDLSHKVIILNLAGQDTSSELAELLTLQNTDTGWGGYEGFGTENLDTALALFALNQSSYPNLETIGYALSYLIDNQNTDGGFGLYFDDNSNIHMTSLVLKIFSSYNGTFDLQDEINDTAAYLLTKQNTDGGFGSSLSTVHETAFAFVSLVQSGQALPLQEAINYIQTAQQVNGSWDDDPYSTALALMALDNVKPNLSISASDMTFSNSTPAVGDMVTITALINNEGPLSADNVLVQLYDGDPDAGGVQIDVDLTIASIAPYGSEPAEIIFNTVGNTGIHKIFVTIDALNEIEELNENDNRVSRNLTVLALPDFYIDSGEITYSPANPTHDEALEMSFFVRNIGELTAGDVLTRLYDGPPESGQLIIENTINNLNGGSGVFVIPTIFTPAPGVHTYYLSVDPENSINETDESNNTGSVTIIVDGTQAEDLSIFPSNISFSPATGIEPGVSITVNAVVNNTGSKNVITDVAFYDSDPAEGGNLIDIRTITVPALGTEIAQLPWTIPVGPVMIFVVVDPANTVFETDETNNMAYKSPYSSLPDLRVRDAGILYYPSSPTPNSSITIEAILENNGGEQSYPYMSLYNDPPESGGTKISTFTYPSTGPIEAFSSLTGTVILPYHNFAIGEHTLYVVADSDNHVDEIYESNNVGQIILTITDDPRTDLFISEKDITFTPLSPLEGEQVTIEVDYHNSGSESVYTYIAFYNGAPQNGGQLISRIQRYVNQESTNTASTVFTMTNDVPEIYVVLDDDNSIQETNENNNTAFKSIDTYSVDLFVNSGDIALSPIFPQDGASIDVNVTVHSAGVIDTAGVLNLYDGDSESGTLISSQNFATGGTPSVAVNFPSVYVYPEDGATLTAVITNASPVEDDLANNSATAVFGENIADGSSNEGKDFWLAFPHVYFNSAELVIQSKHYATVTVDAPSFSWTGTASPGFPAIVPLKYRTLYDLENKIMSDGVIEDKGIHVTSDRDVSVVFHTPLEPSMADDSYLALPVDMLGTEHYVLSYTAWGQHYPSLYVVIATEDNTNVQVSGLVINMDKGQTYQVKQDAVDHSGTYVRSDKPISFIAGTKCSNVTTVPFIVACDSLLEQMLPVSMLGTDYYTAPLYSPVTPDVFRILAAADNTEILLKDRFNEESIFLNAGEWIEYERELETHITSNNPIIVQQFSKGYQTATVGDPFQMTIIPTDKMKTEYRYYTHPGYEDGDFLTVVAPWPETTVLLDGGELNDGWLPLPDGGYYLVMPSTEGEHVITADKPIAVYSHGYRYYGSYGYPAGFALPVANLSVDMTVNPATPQEGQLVNITATLVNEGDKWAKDITVRAFNGDPENGGVQFGEDIYLDILYPRESTTLNFSWETYGHTGVNNIYIVADPENSIKESSEIDNTAMEAVEVLMALQPDPSITDADISLSAQTVDEGESVILSATVKNRGAEIGNVPVSLYLEDPDSGGVLLESKEVFQIIPLNGEAVVDFTFSTAGFNTINNLFVRIDPENTIDELLENNNTAVKQLEVHRKKLNLDVKTNAVQYQANADAGISLFLRNEGTAPWSGTGDVYIKDMSGTQIAHVDTFTVNNLMPLGLESWHYRVPMTINEPKDLYEAIAVAEVNFAPLFASLGVDSETLDLNSIRVLEFDSMDNFIGEKKARFEKDNDFHITDNPSGRVLWLLDGATPANNPRYFYLYFDTTENGIKAISLNSDLPENGKLIAFSGVAGDTYTMKSNGDGTFGAEVNVDKITSSALNGIILRDFNNDSFPDFISADNNQNIYLYRNTADGTDTYLPKIQVGTVESGMQVQDITAADYNNDGNEDFILNMQRADIYLFTGNGEGAFVRSKVADSTGRYFRGKASADINQDGNIDLIVSENNYGIVYIFYGNGDGTFVPPVEIGNIKKEVLSYDSIYGIAVGDVDGNGLNDILINSMRGSCYIIRGVYWEPEGVIFKPMEEVPSLKIAETIGYADLDLVDINGDGNQDVMAARYIDLDSSNESSYLLYFESNGDGSFNPAVTIPTSSYNTTSVSASRISPEVITSIGIPEKIESELFQFTWNTGSTLAGEYFVSAVLNDINSNLISEKSVSIEILPTGDIETNLVPDRIAYYPNETVTIMSSVLNNNVNTIYENITAVVTMKDLADQTLFSEERMISMLTPLSYYSFNTYWNTAAHPSGEYPVTIEVKDASENVLSISTSSITISSESRPSVLLTGQVTVDKQSLLRGEPVDITYSVTNIGNIDLSQVDLSIMTVHAVELTPYDTLTDQTAMLMGETHNNVQQLDTQSYSAKDYLLILQANIQGVEETLASTYFRVEGAPSAPSLNWPIHGEDLETLIPGLIVNNASDPNDDLLTYEFELYADSGLTILLASESAIAESENITTWVVPFELEENAEYVWRAMAYDGILYGDWMPPAAFRINVENDAPSAPILSSPADGSSVDTYRPELTFNNATDPDSEELIYNLEVSLNADFTSIVASESGIVPETDTTAWQVPIDLIENATYYWRARADDWLIEGPWMNTAIFIVDTANDAPTAPHIVAPLEGSEVPALNIDVIAAGAEDPELAPLFYRFEADTAATFDSTELMSSGYIDEGSFETIWNVAGLSDNTIYYLRVNANDSLINSPWSTVVSLFVNTAHDAPNTPVLANPSDGGAVNVLNPSLSVHNSTDLDGDTLTYEFEIYGSATMSGLVADASGVAETDQITSWVVPVALVENEFYFWRVRAFDGELYSEWMPLASFMLNTANDAPGAPILSAPADGTSLETLTPVIAVENAVDPDNDILTYDFEIYEGETLTDSFTGIAEDSSGITSFIIGPPLSDNNSYTWRARAYDGDRYGAWMDMGTFSIHLPVDSITATIDFRPRTLNKSSHGRWVMVFIELPQGYDVSNIDRSTILLEETIPAMPWPYRIGDRDHDGNRDLMLKFRRGDVINVLPEGDEVPVTVTGTVGTTTFEGVDTIRVLPSKTWRHQPPRKRCKGKHYWKRK
ncbi:MAG: CARDB domain-containing protein [Nitrospirota bacterium]